MLLLLEAFLILSFQCQMNGSIRIVQNVRGYSSGKSDVKIDDFWGLGTNQKKTFIVILMGQNCSINGHNSINLSRIE